MLAKSQSTMSIGEFARCAGVAPSTLRFYERVGLIAPASRQNGRRRYLPVALERVALIRLCQDGGFTLAETRQLTAYSRGLHPVWKKLAARKIAELDQRIAQAQRAKDLLEHGLACPSPNILACRNFRAALKYRLAESAS